jgi:hypothetical protein
MKKDRISYGRWLVYLRKALRSTGNFKKGVRPDTKAWKHFYDEGFTPSKAVYEDMGILVPFNFHLY